MKVLWVCNVPNRDVYGHKYQSTTTGGGWLTGLSEALKNDKDIELVYCYPGKDQRIQDDFVVDGIHYYSFYSKTKYKFLRKFGLEAPLENKYDVLQEKQIKYVLDKEKPDIVHIFGTEYYHSLIAQNLCKNKTQTICSIQGLMSICFFHYLSLVPHEIHGNINVSSIFRGSLLKQKMNLKERGIIEERVLRECDNVIGRTEWDKACTYFINKRRNYYFCNETLRSQFYNKKWEISEAEPHSIFMSQASSPLKGLSHNP